MFTAHFGSAEQLQRALQDTRMAEVLGDIKNYHDGMPDIFVGTLLAMPAAG